LHVCIRVHKSYRMGEFHLTCYLVQIHSQLVHFICISTAED
jgi:hypothetical protein